MSGQPSNVIPFATRSHIAQELGRYEPRPGTSGRTTIRNADFGPLPSPSPWVWALADALWEREIGSAAADLPPVLRVVRP